MTGAAASPHNRIFVLAVLAVALVVLVPRSFDLTSDPAEYWPFGTAWGDEGAWNHPAEYAALSGHWPEQPQQVQYLVPLYAWSQRGVFALLGSGLPQARVLSVCSGLLTSIVVGCMLRPLGSTWAWFAAALYGSNFWIIAVDRTATPESLCNLLLSLAMWLACGQGASSALRLCASLVLALLATMAKPPALFGVVTIVVFALWSDKHARRVCGRVLLAGLGLAAAVVGAACLTTAGREVMVLLYGQCRLVLRTYSMASQSGTHWARMLGLSWFQAVTFYEFAVHLLVPIGGAVLLLLVPADPGPVSGRAARLARFATLWMVTWWVLAPLSGFRGFRLAFLLVPLVVLGTLGLERLRVWLGGTRTALRGLRAAPAIFWLAAMWSAWLSDCTGWRARHWWLLSAVALGLLWLLYSRRPTPASVGQDAERGFAWLLPGLVVAQLAVFAAWVPSRTHSVVEAQRILAGVQLGDGVVCGAQAPAVMLAAPLNGKPLYAPYAPDCKLRGRLADYVLLPLGAECLAAHPEPFMVDNAAWLATGPELARVRLHEWNGARPVLCEFSLVRLPARGTT